MAEAAPPQAFQISRQMDQEKIDILTKRIEEFIATNNNLRASAEKNEKDKQDIYLFYQREVEMRDETNIRLNEELIKKENQMKAELEKVKKKHELEMYEERSRSKGEIDGLLAKVAALENEVYTLDSYKREKANHDRKLYELERAVKDHNKQLFDALETQERKFLENKSRLLKDLEEQKEAFRELAARDARNMMDAETRKIMADNRRMQEELKFHNTISEELQKDKARLEHNLGIARRDVSLLSQKEEEWARQGTVKAKEIKALKESVEQLERNQTLLVEKFRHKAKELQGTVQKELEEATLDASGLRQLIKVKNRELRQMKKLAAAILEQRGEVEQFFLEALGEVKDKIREQNRRSSAEAMRELNSLKAASAKRGSTFPAIGAASLAFMQPKAKGTLTHKDADKVFLKDLSLEDKETVLRLLFAKMNGQQSSLDKAVDRSHGGTVAASDRVFLTQNNQGMGMGMGTGMGHFAGSTGSGARHTAGFGNRGNDSGSEGFSSTGGGSRVSHSREDGNFLSRLDAAFPTESHDDDDDDDDDGEVDEQPGLMSMVGLA